MVKNLPAMRKTWVRSLSREDPLEKGMAIPPVFLPVESHGQRSLVGNSPWNCKELDRTKWLTLSLTTIQPWTRCQYPHGWSSKFICNPEINTPSTLLVIYGHVQSRKYLSHPTNTFSCWGLTRCDFLPSWFNSHTINRVLLAVSQCHAFFFAFLCSLLVILLLEIAHDIAL